MGVAPVAKENWYLSVAVEEPGVCGANVTLKCLAEKEVSDTDLAPTKGSEGGTFQASSTNLGSHLGITTKENVAKAFNGARLELAQG